MEGYAFLAVAMATHAVVGYALGAVLFGRPGAGVVGALVADVDFLFPAAVGWPFVHRGITHSILGVAVATAAVVACCRASDGGGRGPRVAAFGVGYLSHLLIDATTPTGVPLLYPLLDRSLYVDLPTTGHSPVPTALLWLACLGVLYRDGSPAPGGASDAAGGDER